jgi:hypothetical protein
MLIWKFPRRGVAEWGHDCCYCVSIEPSLCHQKSNKSILLHGSLKERKGISSRKAALKRGESKDLWEKGFGTDLKEW